MGVARLLCSGLARQHGRERRLPLHQLLQTGQHVGDFVERMQALGAAAQFAGSLRPAQQQHTHQRRLGATEIERLAQPMLVLGHAAIRGPRAAGQPHIFKPMQSLAHRFFIQIHDRLAVGALIACVHQRVQRERIVVGRGRFFFHESAQYAGFGGGEYNGLHGRHRLISTMPCGSRPVNSTRVPGPGILPCHPGFASGTLGSGRLFFFAAKRLPPERRQLALKWCSAPDRRLHGGAKRFLSIRPVFRPYCCFFRVWPSPAAPAPTERNGSPGRSSAQATSMWAIERTPATGRLGVRLEANRGGEIPLVFGSAADAGFRSYARGLSAS